MQIIRKKIYPVLGLGVEVRTVNIGLYDDDVERPHSKLDDEIIIRLK